MLQIIRGDRVCWIGSVKEVTSEIKKLSKEYLFVKQFLKSKIN